jgi:23S rRNA pseudouridine1911/1915/1917 synthase
MSDSRAELKVTLGPVAGLRLDRALAAAVPEGLGLSRSRLQALIGAGAVRSAAGAVLSDPRAPVAGGEAVVIALPEPDASHMGPEDIPLEVLHEDAALIVLMKPAGLAVHPAPGTPSGTLVNALIAHCGTSLSGVGGARRPGIVHRLDKDTSGLIVAAKTDAAHQGLVAQFAARTVERAYVGVCWGAPGPADPRLARLEGISWEPGGWLKIARNIDRHPGDRKRMAAVAAGGRPATTRVRVLEAFGPADRPVTALVACRLETGRTHQIRVHMRYAGHALVGDQTYGGRRAVARGAVDEEAATRLFAFPRQALHAAVLGFRHPVTGDRLRFEAPPPEDITSLLAILRRRDETEPFNES